MPIDPMSAGLSALASTLVESISARYRRKKQGAAVVAIGAAVKSALSQTANVAALRDSDLSILLRDRQLARFVERLVFLRVAEANEQSLDLANEQLIHVATRKLVPELTGEAVKQMIAGIDNVVMSVVSTLEPNIDSGVLQPLISQTEVRLYLEAIVDRLERWRSTSRSDWETYDRDGIDLANHVKATLGFLKPPDLDRIRRIPIDDLFVLPEIVVPQRESVDAPGQPLIIDADQGIITRQSPLTLDVDGEMDASTNLLLLGDPGAGKSTVLAYIAYRVASRKIEGASSAIPLVLTLREYARFQSARGPHSLLAYAAIEATSRYQLPDITNTLELAAHSGELILCVDGLDEVTSVPERQRVVESIEAFIRQFPDCRVIVSSRRAGYERAPIAAPDITIVDILPFDLNRIAQYARKWFATVQAPSPEEHSAGFCRDIEPIQDIAANPLILALLCLLYVGPGHLPESRPEVYRDCADLLYRRWDADRDVALEGAVGGLVRPAIEELAYLLISGDLNPEAEEATRDSQMTQSVLLNHISQLLAQWKYDEDPSAAERAAKSFLRHCQERAWVLVPGPTTASGEATYEFAHRTFQEYLAAAYLVRRARRSEDFLDTFLARVAEPQWTVVLELALQMRSTEYPGDVSDFIDIAVKEILPQDPTDHVRDVVLGSLAYLELRQSTIGSLAAIIARGIVDADLELAVNAVKSRRDNASHVGSAIRTCLRTMHEQAGVIDILRLCLALDLMTGEHLHEFANRRALVSYWHQQLSEYRTDAEEMLVRRLDRDDTPRGDWLLGSILRRDPPPPVDYVRRIGVGSFISHPPDFELPSVPYPEDRAALSFLSAAPLANTLQHSDPAYFDWPEDRAVEKLREAIPEVWNELGGDPVAAWRAVEDVDTWIALLWIVADYGGLDESQLAAVVCEVAGTILTSDAGGLESYVEATRTAFPLANERLLGFVDDGYPRSTMPARESE